MVELGLTNTAMTVIIVNWNGREFLLPCLESILTTRQNLDIQVIVIDNASKDDSVSLIRRRFTDVEIICSERNLGFGKACNLGLSQARGEFIMFLNPDARLEQNTLIQVHRFLKDNMEVAGVGCRVVGEDGKVQPLLVQKFSTPFLEFTKLFGIRGRGLKTFGLDLPIKDPALSGEVIKLSGVCLTVRRSVLEEVGGFDERFFMYCEDGELCQRIVESGRKLYYLAEAGITHIQGSCSRKAPKGFSTIMQCESFSKRSQKYFGRSGALRYRVYMFIGSIIRLSVSSLALLPLLFSKNKAKQIWRQRIRKNMFIFKWSIFATKPTIPE